MLYMLLTKRLVMYARFRPTREKCAASLVFLIPTLQFSKSVIPLFIKVSCVSKSQLRNRQCVLIRQVSTVLSPDWVILVTITFSTFAFSTVDCRSTPVIHLAALSWHPPTIRCPLVMKHAFFTFIFYELPTTHERLHKLLNRRHGNVIFNLILGWTLHRFFQICRLLGVFVRIFSKQN